MPGAEATDRPRPPSNPVPASDQPKPNPDTTAAVQIALGTEHAAVWCYGLISAFLPANLDKRAREDLAAHRARRDNTMRVLTDSGVAPEPAEPAYRLPEPVEDQKAAAQLAVLAEGDAAAAWRYVLERCDDPSMRRTALEGLIDAAVRGARWSGTLDNAPPIPPFPGSP